MAISTIPHPRSERVVRNFIYSTYFLPIGFSIERYSVWTKLIWTNVIGMPDMGLHRVPAYWLFRREDVEVK